MFKAEMEEEEKEQQAVKSKSNTAGESRKQLFDNEVDAGTTTVDTIIANEQVFRNKRKPRNIYRGRSSNTMGV